MPSDDEFGGAWELLSPDGKAVAQGRVDLLPTLDRGDELADLAQWKGTLAPGPYKLTWGAPRYGSTVVRFELRQADDGLAVASLETRRSPEYPPSEQVRMADWVQTTAAEFATGQLDNVVVTDVAGGEIQLALDATEGTYTSVVVTAGFPFNAIVPYWDADIPSDAQMQVAIRVMGPDRGWSEWEPMVDVYWSARKEQFYPEAPVMVPLSTEFQYRVIMLGPRDGSRTPVLRRMTITYMDTTLGPTTSEAKRKTQVGPPSKRGVPKPPIIPRDGWGADESHMTWEPEYRPVQKLVVHHTVTRNGYPEEKAAELVRAIYNYHAVTLDWGDVGYNYLIDDYGNIYEGRYGGPGAVGGHVYSYNYGSMGTGLIGTHGNYPGSVSPSREKWGALSQLMAWEASRSDVNPLGSDPFRDASPPNLGGHRDYPPYKTSCPGEYAYKSLPDLRDSVWRQMVAYMPKYEVEWLGWKSTSEAFESGGVRPGTTYTLQIGARNVGWLTWPPGDGTGSVRLGYHWVDSQGNHVVQPPGHDHRTPLASEVAYGQGYDFESALVTTPMTPGTYTLAWDMVQEGVTWFHDATADSPLLTIQVAVIDESWPAPTATPSPRPTSTSTRTPLPPTHTPVSPTEVPSPTALPGQELVENGGFEQEGGWVIYETAYPARHTTHPVRSGQRALQTGIGDQLENVYSYSSVDQRIALPATGDVVLRYWFQAQIAEGDRAYVLLRPDGGSWWTVQLTRRSVAPWTEGVYSLNAYRGKTVSLRYGTYNDGRGDVSAMYVDDVSIRASGGRPPTPTRTPTPPPPTAAPTQTPLPTSTSVSPTAAPCSELAVNGDFETGTGWMILDTTYPARYSDAVVRTGQRSMQLGIDNLAENRFAYSSADQTFRIPAGQKAVLSFWYRVPEGGGSGDYGYFYLRPGGSQSWRTLRIVRGGTSDWEPFQVDVSHYAGGSFTLRMGMRNNGAWDNAAGAMYVDTLALQGCDP
jgi:hypothetical protein